MTTPEQGSDTAGHILIAFQDQSRCYSDYTDRCVSDIAVTNKGSEPLDCDAMQVQFLVDGARYVPESGRPEGGFQVNPGMEGRFTVSTPIPKSRWHQPVTVQLTDGQGGVLASTAYTDGKW